MFTLHHWADELHHAANCQGGGGPRFTQRPCVNGANLTNQEWSPEGGLVPCKHHSGSSCSQAGAKRHVHIPLDPISKAKRGILTTGQPRIPILLAQACTLDRSLQPHSRGWEKHGSWQSTGYKSHPIGIGNGAPRVSFDSGRNHCHQAGQPPVNKVPTRQRPPASMGAWDLVSSPLHH